MGRGTEGIETCGKRHWKGTEGDRKGWERLKGGVGPKGYKSVEKGIGGIEGIEKGGNVLWWRMKGLKREEKVLWKVTEEIEKGEKEVMGGTEGVEKDGKRLEGECD